MAYESVSTLLLSIASLLALGTCGETGDAAGSGGETSSTSTGGSGTSDGSASSSEPTSTSGGDDSMCMLPVDPNCPEGAKCMPKAPEGTFVPHQLVCSDMVDEPKSIADDCEQFDYYGSCLDDCDNGLVCVVEEFERLSGTCRPMCDPADNGCPTDQICKPFFETIEDAEEVPICMPKCDPLTQDCPGPGWQCFPEVFGAPGGGGGFLCIPPAPFPQGMLGDACFLGNSCEAGLVCLTYDLVPGCQPDDGLCCSRYCDLTDNTTDESCDADLPGTQCVSWGSPDPDHADVGACALPL